MLKTLLASLAITAMGAVAATAATLSVVIDDYYADLDNAFYVYDYSDYSYVGYQSVGSLDSGYNEYVYDVDPGYYYIGVYEDYGDGIDYVGVFGNGSFLTGCSDCDFHGWEGDWVYVSEMSAVPLPASAALLLAGLAGLGVMRRRNKS